MRRTPPGRRRRGVNEIGVDSDSGFFGTLKSEFFHGRDWEGVDRDGFMVELHRWLLWFRSGRASESLGWRTPDENRRLLGYAV